MKTELAEERETRHPGCCPVVRTILRKHVAFSGEVLSEKWGEEFCNVPLFGEQVAKGICLSCERGWNHPENYISGGPRPEKEGYANS